MTEMGKERFQPERPFSPLEMEISRELNKGKRPARIDFEMLFGGHDLEEHAVLMRLAEKIPKTDLLLIEGPGMPQSTLKLFQAVSDGTLDPKTLHVQNPFHMRMLEALYKSKARVQLWDVGEGDPLALKTQVDLEEGKFFGGSITAMHTPLNKALEMYDALTDQLAETIVQREKKTIGMLSKKILSAVSKVPQLRVKSPLKVLSVWGAVHTPLFTGLKDVHPPRKRTMAPSPFVFPPTAELMRRKAFGLPVSPELLKMGLLENIFTVYQTELLPPKLKYAEFEAARRRIMEAALPSLPALYKLHMLENNADGALSLLRIAAQKTGPNRKKK